MSFLREVTSRLFNGADAVSFENNRDSLTAITNTIKDKTQSLQNRTEALKQLLELQLDAPLAIKLFKEGLEDVEDELRVHIRHRIWDLNGHEKDAREVFDANPFDPTILKAVNDYIGGWRRPQELQDREYALQLARQESRAYRGGGFLPVASASGAPAKRPLVNRSFLPMDASRVPSRYGDGLAGAEEAADGLEQAAGRTQRVAEEARYEQRERVFAHPRYTHRQFNEHSRIFGGRSLLGTLKISGEYLLRSNSENVIKLAFMMRDGSLYNEIFHPIDLDNLETIVKMLMIEKDPLFEKECDKARAEELLKREKSKVILRKEDGLYVLSRVDAFNEIQHLPIDPLPEARDFPAVLNKFISESTRVDDCPLTLEDVSSLEDPYTLGMHTFDREALLEALEREPLHPVTRQPVSERQIELVKYHWKIGSYFNKFWFLDNLNPHDRKEALERLNEWPRPERRHPR